MPGGARAAPLSCDEALALLPSGGADAAADVADGFWHAIAGADEAWTQRAEYPYRKHEVTLAAAAQRPESPEARDGPPAEAAPAPAARAPRVASGSGFVTKRMIQALLESALADFDPLTTLYTPAMRRMAAEELRKALLDFAATAEAHFQFGMPKAQAASAALSGAKHPDIWAIRDVLAFVVDREDLALPDGTPSAPPGAAKVAR